jgi:sugar O-acyltransferase (sialic acid O-acetyltransferase NeuD family)
LNSITDEKKSMMPGKEMRKPIILWGGTGQAKVLREFIGQCGYRIVALFDNNPLICSPIDGLALYHGKKGFQEWLSRYDKKETSTLSCLVAIGGANGRDRLDIMGYLESCGLVPVTVIHPTAFVAEDAEIDRGSQILANSSVCTHVKIGEGCIVNTGAVVDHDTVLLNGVHIGPGACVAGEVRIGFCSMIGAGSVVLPQVHIGNGVVVGAGSVVTGNVADGVVVCGNPANEMRRTT